MGITNDDSDDVGRALVGMPALSKDEKEARASYHESLVQFFEDAAFYRKCQFPETGPKNRASLEGGSWTQKSTQLRVPADLRISVLCALCDDSKRTFAAEFGPQSDRGQATHLQVDESRLLQFRCTHCQKQHVAFLVHVGRTPETQSLHLVKAGVWPSARPAASHELTKALGPAAELFSRGLIAEKFGFGIGAFAYYRRVTEDIIDRLLLSLRSYADDAGSANLVAAIDATANETQLSKRIAVVKDLVPKILRPDGLNPLGTLYDALSDGLHGRSDEDCLCQAEALRIALDFLVTRLDSLVTTPKQFVDAMRKLKAPAASKTSDRSKPT